MGQLYIMLRCDLKGLGKKGQVISKEVFDAFVREQIDGLEQFLRPLRSDDEVTQPTQLDT